MKRTMQHNGTLTLRHNNKDFDAIIVFISELIDRLSNVSLSISKENNEFLYYLHVRNQRREVEKTIKDFLKTYEELSESKKVAIELNFYRAVKKLHAIAPKAKKEVDERSNFIMRYCLKRELSKTLEMVESTQRSMAKSLYTDRTEEFNSNPHLYKEMEDAWGDWAKQD
jgi:hypothetical protein